MECTIAAGEGAAPLEIGFALQRLRVAERVPGLAAERHQGAHVEVVAVSLAVDRYAGVHAVIRLQLQSCGMSIKTPKHARSNTQTLHISPVINTERSPRKKKGQAGVKKC